MTYFQHLDTAARDVEHVAALIEQSVAPLAAQQDLAARGFNDHLRELSALPARLKSDFQRFQQENMKLRVGVVGRIKAGKSSMLNGLLFDGKPILAKAATPMTAALTRICYGEQALAEITYYTPAEWQEVLATTREERGEQSEAARTQLEANRGLDLGSLLGKKETIPVARLEDLLGQLKEYIGVGGRYTGIVAEMTLMLPDERLREIEVVDTPGLNDPVVSRSRRTRRYLGQCDVVLLLSRTSSGFLDRGDMELLSQHLPGDGIGRCIVVGTQMDLAMLGPEFRDVDPPTAYAEVEQKIKHRALQVARDLDAEQAGKHLAPVIAATAHPILISTVAWSIRRHWGNLDRDGQHVLDRFAKIWPNAPLSADDWGEIGNMEAIQEALSQIAAEKWPTLSQRLAELSPGAVGRACNLLDAIVTLAEKRVASLERGDLKRLGASRASLQQAIKRAETGVSSIFANLKAQARERKLQVLSDMEHQQQGIDEVQLATGTRQEKYQTTETRTRQSYVLWFIPWGTESYDVEVTRTRTVSYRYAEADDAFDRVEAYAQQAARQISRHINSILHRDSLIEQLKNVLNDSLDRTSETFDARVLVDAVEGVAQRILLPEIHLDPNAYTETIASEFAGKIMESDVNSLKRSIRRASRAVLTDVEKAFSEEIARFEAGIDALSHDFLAAVLRSVNEDLARLERELGDKDAEVERYRSLATQVGESRKKLDVASQRI